MDKVEELSVESVVTKLGLSNLPKQRAYEIIAENVTHGLFEMYFDESVVGTDATGDVEMALDEHGTVTGGLIANGYSTEHCGRKVAAGVDVYHSNDRFKFAVNDYYFEDKKFYPTDSEGIWHRQKLIDVDLVSFNRSQIDTFAKANNFSKGKADQGLLKALALLAREKADNGGEKYKKGDHVNASAFKKHIISLAKHYKISDGYLKSLDDKVKTALKDLELNEIDPR